MGKCSEPTSQHEAVFPFRRQGTRYTDGLLFGSVIKRLGTETHDTHEQRSTTHREAGRAKEGGSVEVVVGRGSLPYWLS